MKSLLLFSLSAMFEIAGCFAFWQWARSGKPVLWLIPGVACLISFAWVLTRVDVTYAGRAYAIYGGIYIAASLLWLWVVEHQQPDRWDLIGAGICIAGAMVMLYAPRS